MLQHFKNNIFGFKWKNVGEGPILVGPFKNVILFLYTNTCRSIAYALVTSYSNCKRLLV